jgi:hypothetical protein
MPCASRITDLGVAREMAGSVGNAWRRERHPNVGRRTRPSGIAARDGGLVQRGEHLGQPVVARAREAKLTQLGEAHLTQGDRVLRVATGDQRQVGERREQRCREPLLKSRHELRRQRETEVLGERDTVPEASVREEVIVLALVPRPVGKQRAREMRLETASSVNEPLGVLRAAEGRARRNQGGVVPRLAVRESLVVRHDQRRAGLDDPIADDAAKRVA